MEGEESLLPEAFTWMMLEHLEEAGEFDEAHACYHRDRGLEVSGYGVNDDADTVSLFTTVYRGDVPPGSVGKQDVETAYRRLLGFWTRASDSYYKSLED